MTAAAISMVGCASRGTDFSMSDVDALQPGVTTLQDAQAKLGKANNISRSANGDVTAMWQRIEVFMGSGKSRSVLIKFDKNETMIQVISRNEGSS